MKLKDVEEIEDIVLVSPFDNPRLIWAFQVGVETVQRMIKEQSVVEAEPIIHAKWEWNEDICWYRCSNCKRPTSVPFGNLLPKRCPDCNAIMSGREINDNHARQ